MTGTEGARPGPEPGGPPRALRIPAGHTDGYRQLAQTAALLGRGIADLGGAARLLGAPDPAALGAEGADWANYENSGVVLQAWARMVLDHLDQPTNGLIVVERRLERP